MVATTIEQSNHLLELGLDPKTADMVWMCNKWLYSIKDNILNREQFSEQDTLAWSLDALLDALGDSQLGVWRLFKLILHEGYMLCTDSPNGGRSYCAKTKIEAVYKAVVDMLERNVMYKFLKQQNNE